MKKILSYIAVLYFNDCVAATGNASDGELFALSTILLVILIIAFGYFIDFMQKKISCYRASRKIKKNEKEIEVFKELSRGIPEFNI